MLNFTGNTIQETHGRATGIIRFVGVVVLVLAASFILAALAQPAASNATQAPLRPQAEVNACGTVTTSTTWTAGNVYAASNCYVEVAAGVTLTLEPGVIVKFGGACPTAGCAEGSVALRVDGTLIVSGTLEQPVIFTSLADDAHGGDTNGDGPSEGVAGEWYGLVFNTGSHGELTHVFVGYAGSGVFNDDLGYGRAQVDVRGGDLQLRSSTVITGSQKGLYLEGDGITPIIQDIYVVGNHMSDSKGYAIYQDNINMQPTYGNLTLSGNDQDQVIIGRVNEALSQDVTLSGADFGFRCGYTLCQMTVPNSTTLTIAPGTSLNFGPSYGIAVAAGGALIAEGTATQPITFTSPLTETGYWIGLWAQQGSTLRLDQCDLSYASDGNYGNGGLEINTDDAQVRNCRIHHNQQTGLYIYSRNGSSIHLALTHVDVTHNGGYGVDLVTSSGSVTSLTWDDSNISQNGYAGVRTYNFAGQGMIELTLKHITISENGMAATYEYERPGIRADYDNVNLTLGDVALTHNAGDALYWTCNGFITARNLTAFGNGTDDLRLLGCSVASGRQWNLAEAGLPARVTGGISIPSNGLLSLTPGTTLHFDAGQQVQISGGALYALGTPNKPIVFTRTIETQDPWPGLYVNNGTLILRHFELAYAGNLNNPALTITGDQSFVIVQNSKIHHSGYDGVNSGVDTPILHYNEIYANGNSGVIRTWGATPVDARYNWWGDATGPYHATLNPSGLGDQVGDNVLFDPWLTAPPENNQVVSELLVTTGTPRLVSPGQTTDFAIQYLNLMTSTVENAILMIQLPQASDYVDSTGAGIYWPERHQVFWKLGNLPPGAQGFISVRVQFQWGLPRNYKDGSITLLAADNYNVGQLDVAAYMAYQPVTVTAQVPISQTEFDALRAATPNLQTLYTQAIAQGYTYLEAVRVTYSDGASVTGAAFRTPDRRWVRLLTLYDGQALAVSSGEGLYTLHDTTGGMTTTLSTLSREYWGNWVPDAGAQTFGAMSPSACSLARCKFNCIGKKVTFKFVTYSLGKMFMWTIATGGGGGLASAAFHTAHVTKMIYDCNNECNNDPNSNCCTTGQVRWTPSGWFKLFGSACVKEVCNATTGTYGNPGTIYCTAGGQRCVAGYGDKGGCKNCAESAGLYNAVTVRAPQTVCAVTGLPKCSDLELLVAKDPNAIYGPEGDLLPGQLVTYTITYENEGEGRAYGVYVINTLPAVFDANTLDLYGNGAYLPESREIIWLVGELGPKGDPDSEGAITYTVYLKSGLPSSTVVSNEAIVYFPSVPEETPTNVWINLIAPLVAVPQTLRTDYRTPLTLTLEGREISGLLITYMLEELPIGGILTGTLPTLTYTPTADFTGPDAFMFRVSNGITESRPAQVRIDISAAGDMDTPRVLWNTPDNGAQEVVAAATPVFTDTQGAIYPPVILIGFSEALSATTVTSQTVRLENAGGIAPASVTYDGLFNQVTLAPRAPLQVGAVYTVRVTTGVTDMAGNPMATEFVWHFTTAGSAYRYVYLPLVLRNH